MKNPRRLIEIFIANGSTFPFEAQWHQPGHKLHGKIAEVIKRCDVDPDGFITPDRSWGGIFADPARGIGWIAVDEPQTFSIESLLAQIDKKENV